MKNRLLTLLEWKLKKLAQLTIWRYRPGIVGVTGSVGKTSTKLAIAAVLGTERTVRYSHGNFNGEIGLPLTILGDWSERELMLLSREHPPGKNVLRKIFFLLKVLCVSAFRIVVKGHYPEILVLEYGIDRPGDMKYLLSIARPNVSIVTAIGEVPAHVEFFNDPEEVAREKARLIEYLPAAGFAILNYDDDTVMGIESRTRAHVMTFGFTKDAEVRITGFDSRFVEERPEGVTFKLEYGGSFVPVRLDNVFGKTQAYAAAAAACVGLVFGLNLVKISEALKNYVPAEHRLSLVPGIKYTFILDDCYNASPLSMRAALATLRDLPARRRVAVLGDMLEIGKYSVEAHEEIGRGVSAIADVIVTIGARAKFIAEAARSEGFNKKNIFSFDTPDEAKATVREVLKKGDLVLVKASRGMHLEKVVEEVKAF
jgi:UDP-N-acetylmuramoyl-tripeptide--D-alanyl-D-alanine ligase